MTHSLRRCSRTVFPSRRFVGLSLEDDTPDETTFVVFRRRLRETGHDKRRGRGQPELSFAQKFINRTCSVIRAVVEYPFAWMKNMGYGRARYRGLIRNALDFALMATAYNWKRSFSLVP